MSSHFRDRLRWRHRRSFEKLGGPSRHGRRGRKRKEQQQRKVEGRRKRQSGQEQRRILDQNRIEYAGRLDWRYLKNQAWWGLNKNY
jgi:hypothetical protein